MIPETNVCLMKGDAYDLIKRIPEKSIDLIIVDPPYEIAERKQSSSRNRIDRNVSNLVHELAEAGVTEGIHEQILDEFMRIMKKPNIYVWCNKKQILQYLNFFVGKHQCAFDILVWIKTNPIPLCGSNYLNDKEYCLYFRKNKKMHASYPRAKTYWITQTNKADKMLYGHPTVKPIEIIKTLIENSSDPQDVVLDCFLGSGTTGAAAVELDRSFIGMEISDKYFDVAEKRIYKIWQQMDKGKDGHGFDVRKLV